jgi:hypothetical protein
MSPSAGALTPRSSDSLCDERRRTAAVRVLELHHDLGLTMRPTIYLSVA